MQQHNNLRSKTQFPTFQKWGEEGVKFIRDTKQTVPRKYRGLVTNFFDLSKNRRYTSTTEKIIDFLAGLILFGGVHWVLLSQVEGFDFFGFPLIIWPAGLVVSFSLYFLLSKRRYWLGTGAIIGWGIPITLFMVRLFALR